MLCFFLSGFAALLYETAWAREFEFVFGTSEVAVVSVLAAYMGGLAAGSAAGGQLVRHVRRPVLWYGLLELGIALSALAVPLAIRGATWLHVAWMGGQGAPPAAAGLAGAAFYVAAAFAILLIPTGLMGATLPLLARHAVRREEEIGQRVGALYAVNTAGAVAGTAITGFVLLPELGLRSTVFVGAATNALVFAAAAVLARAMAARPETLQAEVVKRPPFHWVLPLVALSGAASFSYEVLWSRLLGHLVGGTLQGFATMLASFLLGIALGGALASRLARTPLGAARGFTVAQLGTALLSIAAFLAVDRLPELADRIGAGNAGAWAGNALISALGLLPSSLCIGAVFPFAVRMLARDESEAGPAAARVYVWNTLGSITGALATGFVLLPALHFEGTVSLAIGVNLALALCAASLTRPSPRLLAGLATAGLVALCFVRPGAPWAVLRHSSMLAANSSWRGEVAFHAVGRSSTVLLLEQWQGWRLTTNGLPESLVSRDGPVPKPPEPARWLSLLPVLLRPELSRMLIVGLGGGLTVESVPSTVQEISVIELEDEVMRAHEWLATRRSTSPLSDPRVHLVLNDARGALQLTDARFGAIISQPSHPWTAGASHLYTREFFSLAAEHLEPDGVFVQWIGVPFVSEPLLRSMVATLLDVFPHVSIFRPAVGAILFAASMEPFDLLRTSERALARAPDDFARFGLYVSEDVAAALALDTDDARDFAAGAPIVSDDRNPLATRSFQIGARALTNPRADALFSAYDPLSRAGDGIDWLYLIRRMTADGATTRAARIAEKLPEAERFTALGWARSVYAPGRSVGSFRRALQADPTSQAARFGLVRVLRKQLEAGDPETLALAAPLEGNAALVVQGWRHAANEEWSELRALEPALASIPPRDPTQPDALRLRIRWREVDPDPALRAEGAGLALGMLENNPGVEAMLTAARALLAAQRPEEALFVLDFVSRSRRTPADRRAALGLLESLRPQSDPESWSEIQARMLRARRGS